MVGSSWTLAGGGITTQWEVSGSCLQLLKTAQPLTSIVLPPLKVCYVHVLNDLEQGISEDPKQICTGSISDKLCDHWGLWVLRRAVLEIFLWGVRESEILSGMLSACWWKLVSNLMVL